MVFVFLCGERHTATIFIFLLNICFTKWEDIHLPNGCLSYLIKCALITCWFWVINTQEKFEI